MGIDGLLNLLKPVTQKEHISTFKGKTVAVDAMPWIYKGCYSCAMELNQNVESIDFLYYILEMLDMLSYYQIKPIFVFDGRALMAKNDTLQKRKKNKQQNKQKGLEFLKNNQLDEARKYLSRCIIIDERIITMTINCLVTKNVQFYVAPYEADCQIAKLKRLQMIDAVISEDSDLIIFGLNVILKLNQNGECDYVDLLKWKPRDVNDVFLKYFLAFDELSKIDAAILAGSDYNQSVKGIGIKRAIKLLTTQVTMKNVINKLKYKKTYMARIPEDYEETVERSKLIFNLSTVYNPLEKRLEYLRPELVAELKPEEMTEEQLREIVGRHYEYSEEVVNGRVSSKTLEKREIKVLNFPQIFRVNKENMMAHEAMIKRKKFEEQKAKKDLLEHSNISGIEENRNQNIEDDIIFEQLKEFKKRSVIEETPEEIERRKEERKNRINKLHEIMNSFVDIFGDDSSEEEIVEKQNEDNDEEKEEGKEKEGETEPKVQFYNPFLRKDLYGPNLNPHLQFHPNTNQSDNSYPSKPNNLNVSIEKTICKPTPATALHQRNSKKEREVNYAHESDSVSDELSFLNPFDKQQLKTAQKLKTSQKIKTSQKAKLTNQKEKMGTKNFKSNSGMKQQTLNFFKN